MYKGDFPLKTKIITTAEAVPGMIVAEDIFGLQDYLIIPAHSELTNHSITRLKFYAINQIKIEINEDGEPERMDYGNTASDTYSEYIKSTLEFKKFNQAYDSVVTDFKKKIATVNGKKTSYTNKGLKRKKTYYYIIRAYRIIDGVKVYGNASAGKGLSM